MSTSRQIISSWDSGYEYASLALLVWVTLWCTDSLGWSLPSVSDSLWHHIKIFCDECWRGPTDAERKIKTSGRGWSLNLSTALRSSWFVTHTHVSYLPFLWSLTFWMKMLLTSECVHIQPFAVKFTSVPVLGWLKWNLLCFLLPHGLTSCPF